MHQYLKVFSCGMLILFSMHDGFCAPQNTMHLLVEPEAGRAPVLEAIDHAQQEIDLVMYLFTDKKIARALERAAQRGVIVKALIEQSPYEFEGANQWLSQAWKNTAIQWQWVPGSNRAIHYYHQKTMLIDHQQLWIMTLNFVYSSFAQYQLERNFIMVDQAPADIAQASSLFAQDWQRHITSSKLTQLTRLVVSPINTESQLMRVVTHAQHQLNVYAEGLEDYKIIGAFAAAADRGVRVKIIYGTTANKAQHYLMHHGVMLKQAVQFHNHAKAMVADDAIAYVGSANFTENSFNNNRELGIIIDDPTIAQRLDEQFSHDFNTKNARP